jgi:hypothetical protein
LDDFRKKKWEKKDNWTLISSRRSLYWSPSAIFDLI